MLEKEIEDKVCRYAKQQGLLVYKFTSPNYRSVPDRLLLNPDGRCFFIEFKSPKGRCTEAQTREIRRLSNHGQSVYICNDIELGKQIIDYEVKNTASCLPAKGD